MKKLLAVLLVGALAVSAVGCGGGGKDTGNTGKNAAGQTEITVAGWPSEKGSPKSFAQYEDMKKRFEEANPDVSIVPEAWSFSLDTFLAKAAAGQLPTLYEAYFTEADRIMSAGYSADLTKAVKKYGYDEMMKDAIKEIVMSDGKYYSIPKSAYVMGMYLNKNVFEAAGLTNEDGSIKIPQTYDELAQYAKEIKDKTGQYGIVLTTAQNQGGWQFLNMAWSYGAEFMKQDENGKWIATFDSPEAAAALQYIKDLKWKYDVIPDSAVNVIADQNKYFGSDQAGMFLGTPPQDDLAKVYNMDLSDIVISHLPAGPAGRYAQVGGALAVIKNGSTDDQIDATFRWLEHSNNGAGISDDIKKSMEDSYAVRAEDGRPIGFYQYSPWNDKAEKVAYEQSIVDKYANMPKENVKAFNEAPADLKLNPEPPVACQELYAVLDAVIQEVITNENADPAALLKEANASFQRDHLDIAQ